MLCKQIDDLFIYNTTVPQSRKFLKNQPHAYLYTIIIPLKRCACIAYMLTYMWAFPKMSLIICEKLKPKSNPNEIQYIQMFKDHLYL